MVMNTTAKELEHVRALASPIRAMVHGILIGGLYALEMRAIALGFVTFVLTILYERASLARNYSDLAAALEHRRGLAYRRGVEDAYQASARCIRRMVQFWHERPDEPGLLNDFAELAEALEIDGREGRV